MLDIVQRARRQNRPISVCGEMAGDSATAFLLLGFGVESLNMPPSGLAHLKWTIRSFTMRQARKLADKALKVDNEADTHRLLNQALKAAGLSSFVREN